MRTRDELLAYLADIGVEATTYDHPAIFTVGETRATTPRPAARPAAAHRSEGNAAISKDWSEF